MCECWLVAMCEEEVVVWAGLLRLDCLLLCRIGAAKVCWCLGNVYTEMGQHDKAYHFAHRHLELSMQVCACWHRCAPCSLFPC